MKKVTLSILLIITLLIKNETYYKNTINLSQRAGGLNKGKWKEREFCVAGESSVVQLSLAYGIELYTIND